MKTVGDILKQARLKKGLSLRQVSLQTKIRFSYLKAIETNSFSQLPATPFVKGFIQNFAKVVDADPKTALAIFRRDFIQDPGGKIIPRGMAKPINPRFFFTPRLVTSLALGLISLVIIAIFSRQIYLFYAKPSLTVFLPLDSSQVTSPLAITGQASVDAAVFVNQQPVSKDDSGNFSIEVQLTPGDHTIIVEATNRNHKTSTIQRFVNVIEN